MASTIDNVLSVLAEVQKTLAEVQKENKSMAKLIRKLRASQDDPDGEKAKARAKNNGFNIPRKITPEFSKFLKLADDELITRSQVNKKISEYVNANNLKHPENGRIILIDDALRALLDPPADIQITYLNIQKYLSKHYIKDEAAEKPAKAEKPTKEPKVEKPKEVSVDETPGTPKTDKPKVKRPEVKVATKKA